MMRALFAGVSGLRSHLVRMDVIGNNIANVNTVAFKTSRVTFKEAFAQLLRGAARPVGDQGGLNPIQVGLGTSIGSIDQDFRQGNLENTGQVTDLAIQGDGFFAVSDGSRRFYTRAGNFQLDASGHLVAPNNGFVLQGRLADATGSLSSTSAIQDVALPLGQKAPAHPTSNVSFTGNLDSRDVPLGTVLETKGLLLGIEQTTSNAGAGSDVNGLYANGNADAQVLGMTDGRTTVTVSDGTTTKTYTYVTLDTGIGDLAFHSLKDLIGEINNDFGATMTASLDSVTGALRFLAGAAPITLALSSTNSTLGNALQSANGALAAAATATSDQFSHIAVTTDLLTSLRNGTGTSLGLAGGQTITVDGNKGGTAVAQGSLAVTGASTYNDYLIAIDSAFGVVNPTGVAANASTGALRITGDGGLVNALSGVNIVVTGGFAPNFDAMMNGAPGNYRLLQTATDVTNAASITVYDSIGNPHVISMTFTKDPTASNRWTWQVGVPQPAAVTGGDSGAVTFDSNGRLESFTYNSGSTSFQFDPNTGASAPVDIQFNSGTQGDINGLSQFAAASTAVASGQDGYPMGNLENISIDSSGTITGSFTNGVNQTLAQIVLASFNNPGGLVRTGDNMYTTSGNSGEGVLGFAGTSNQSSITSGALESSNVDLAAEFTSMIVAQRGFQANARVITTSDEMLTELVNLKR
jgi:flagellar hook protein FlgE